MPIDIVDAPAYYDHEAAIPVIVQIMTLDRVRTTCLGLSGPPPAGQNFYGCSIARPTACFVVVPVPDGKMIMREDQLRIWRHERAHCNGWPKDHSLPPEAQAKTANAAANAAGHSSAGQPGGGGTAGNPK